MYRKTLVVLVFALLAASGLAATTRFAPGSVWHALAFLALFFCLTMGLLYILQSPAGNRASQPHAASASRYSPREINLTVEATFSQLVPASALLADEDILDLPCLLTIGSDGFSSRLWRADKVGGPWPSGETLILNAEFLKPEQALPRFPVGVSAQVWVDDAAIGSVTVVRHYGGINPVNAASANVG